jgi:tetratricopeptide (TPR) repeat protein
MTAETGPELGESTTISLAPLDADGTRDLLGRLIPGSNESIVHMAAGTPARVEQLAGWLLDGHTLTDTPSTLVDLVSQRILRLSTSQRTLVQALAAFGGRVERHRLEALVPADSLVTVPALVRLEGHEAWLHSDLVTRVALACTPVDVRRRLHRQALEALGQDVEPVVRASHAELAEDFELAYAMFTKAGMDAFNRFDCRGAARHYARAAASARQLHRRGYPEAGRRFVAATIFAAEALIDAGEIVQAESMLDEAELFSPAGSQLAACERARGLAWLAQGRSQEGCQRLERAISSGLASGDLELVCDAYLELGEAQVRMGQSDRARAELAQALDVATGGVGWSNARAPRRLWRVGYRLAELALEAGDHDVARQVASDALAHARRRSSDNGQARLSALMARICESSGDFASALRYRANAIKGLRNLGDRRSTAELLLASSSLSDSNDRDTVDYARTLAREIGWVDGATGDGEDS